MEKETFRRLKKETLSTAEVQKLGLNLKAVKKKIGEILKNLLLSPTMSANFVGLFVRVIIQMVVKTLILGL